MFLNSDRSSSCEAAESGALQGYVMHSDIHSVRYIVHTDAIATYVFVHGLQCQVREATQSIDTVPILKPWHALEFEPEQMWDTYS